MARVYLKTFGCTLNRYDSDVMEAYLLDAGYSLVDSLDNSDVIIINTCGVKKQTEDKVISYLRAIRARYPNKKLIATGCLPPINFERLTAECSLDGVLGPSPGNEIVKALDAVLSGDRYIHLNTNRIESPKIVRNSVTVPLAVSSGCLDKCSFCGTKNARGVVKSLDPSTVKKAIMEYVSRGVKEILLTSVDLGAYGYDLKPRRSYIDLLKEIKSIPGNFVVRIGMINPRWVYSHLDELIEVFEDNGHFYHFLHIPVQSGSDKVLRIMNRGHGVEEYIESVKRLRKEIGEDFTIMTDIIVGHPGETDEDFELTLDLIRESRPDFVNISQFFPRPNTPSAKMKKIPTKIIKERSRVVSRLCDVVLYDRNRMWRGWEGPILVNEFGKGRYLGRNYAYKIFAVESEVDLMGKIVEVRSERVYTTWLYAVLRREASSIFGLN